MVIFSVISGNKAQLKNDVNIMTQSPKLLDILQERKRNWMKRSGQEAQPLPAAAEIVEHDTIPVPAPGV